LAFSNNETRRLWNVWKSNLPASVIQDLRNSGKIVVFDGDITVPNCGLKSEDLSTVRDKATIFVHAASTINLTWSLSKVAPSIVHGSLIVANLALTCPKLVKFVYISTFYSSTFLQKDANGSLVGADAVVSEDIHQIPNTSCSLDELLGELETSGTTTECKKVQFYNSYSYAKNLTERLLLRKFEQNSTTNKLLIFRPCSIGPAQEYPFPFFELPGSCPITTFYAMALTMPPVKLGFSSFLKDPTKSTYLEVPIDIAVNRLVAHTAYGTQGCVYAVPKGGQGQSVMKTWDWVSELRPSWLSRPEMVWYAEDWRSDRICPLGRVYGLCGTAFKFEDTKSTQVWEAMSHHEQIAWLFWDYNLQ
jgi:fatty acyl-CoA reductase